MTSRSRGYSSQADWDPMQDDFDNSNYDPQYPDENSSDQVRLDHTRLYITNIPKGLNDSALKTAFSKYGTLVEVFVSKHPLKRYGLVGYETPAEARHAMMKLNKTEPLRLNISVAHEKKDSNKRDNNSKRDSKSRLPGQQRESTTSTRERSNNRDDQASCTSRGTRNIHVRKVEDMANGDNLLPSDDLVMKLDDELGLESMDVAIELDRLQFEQLKVKQAQLAYKQRILLRQMEKRNSQASQSQPNNKLLTEGRKISIRNTIEGSGEHRDGDSSFAAGAGDSLNLPGLQCTPSCECVVCGAVAYSYCAGCGVTPYCSQACQRRDWLDRHKSVCHNLVNQPEPVDLEITKSIAPLPAAPLRRPRSPQREPRNDDDGSQKNYMPSGHRQYNNKPTNRQGGSEKRFNNRSDDRPSRRANDDDWDSKAAKPNSSEGPKHSPAKTFQATAAAKDKEPLQITIKRDVDTGTSNQRKVETPVANPREEKTPPANHREEKTSVANNREEKTPQKVEKTPVANQKPLATVSDATPITKLVPKNYMVELLSVGDSVMLSVDALAKDCASKSPGFVCLSLHEKYEAEYQQLCEAYGAACESEKGDYTVTPGETFSYFNPEDGGWYRARCLSSTTAALVDGGRVVQLTAGSRVTCMPPGFPQPEFCCLVEGRVKVGDSLACVIQEKTPHGVKVAIARAEDGSAMGDAMISRWIPEVKYPPPQPKPAQGSTNGAVIPEVPRPEVTNKSQVHIVHMTDTSHVYVKVADTKVQRDFDAALHDTAMYGLSAKPLSQPPLQGQYVVSKFTDGHHYRALVRRTNYRQNKYLLEYLEFGNTQINTLENLYPCPDSLSIDALPVVTSRVGLLLSEQQPLTPPADRYVERLKDDSVPLVLTIPSGAKSAPSGSEVQLTETDSKQCVNERLTQLCTPEWATLQNQGRDMLEVAPFMFSDLEYLELPANGCEVCLLDLTALAGGTVSGCLLGTPHMEFVLNVLTEKMKQYCESPIGKQPYLPISEELCIAQMPPYPQWFRAVYIGPVGGPGSAQAELCYIDYGNVEKVPTEGIRKMPTEFAKGVPALVNTLEIRDFPQDPTIEMMEKAFNYLKINDEGQGVMKVSRCTKDGPGMYVVEAPELLAAMRGN